MPLSRLARGWASVAVATILSAAPAGAAQRYFARFDPAPEGPILVFNDDFESGGTCDWVSTEPCVLYILTIPPGTDIGDHGFPTAIQLQVGAALHIVNGDPTPHRIHANGSIGIPHQASSMGQGEEYVGTVTQVGQDSLYCHDHGTESGTLIVNVQ